MDSKFFYFFYFIFLVSFLFIVILFLYKQVPKCNNLYYVFFFE